MTISTTLNTIPEILETANYQDQEVIVEYNEDGFLKVARGMLTTIFTSTGDAGGTTLAIELTASVADPSQVDVRVWNPNRNNNAGGFTPVNGPYARVLIPWERVVSVDVQ